MKAKIFNATQTKRVPLHEVVPLKAPFVVTIDPYDGCNMKCFFCFQSLPREQLIESGYNPVTRSMDMEVFNKFCEQLKMFPNKIKVINFGSRSEPTLHKKLPFMIDTLTHADVAERIRIITNGTLLTPKLSSELINAGVTNFVISVNGFSENEYKNNCGIKLNFEKYLENLTFLYENKKQCEISIKTLNTIIGERDREVFYNIFGNICDKIVIENEVKVVQGFLKKPHNLNEGVQKTSLYFNENKNVEICSTIFTCMIIRPDGKGKICPKESYSHSVSFDVSDLFNTWNGEAHKKLLLHNLRTKRKAEGCRDCGCANRLAFDENYLDPYADEIIERVMKL